MSLVDYSPLTHQGYQSQSSLTIGSVLSLPPQQGLSQAALAELWQPRGTMPQGTKPLVVCAGVVTEAKDLDDAQRLAEEQAHSKGANAYILKPVRMVAPKRDVVTTEL